MQLGPYDISGRYCLAPLAGLVSRSYRGIARQFGAAATPTELISACGLTHRNRRTAALVRPAPGEHPFWVQLFGAAPAELAAAAEVAVALGANIIDLNMGCPVRKVTASGAGAAMMQDPPRAVAAASAIRAAVGAAVPVTVKLRAGWDSGSVNAVELGQRLEQAGVAALCLHPRTRSQAYGGRADWSLIAALKRAVRIPVIGNGDVKSVDDAERLSGETGCDAIMIGRAALGNPWLFSSLALGRPLLPTPAERAAVVLDHLRRLVDEIGDPQRALLRFRSRALYYSRRLQGGAEFRRRIMQIRELEPLQQELGRYFGQAERVPDRPAAARCEP
ncbi:MAG: tRNA dihydrouridine synthase DusB [Deltaproteobacteria bacterium]|nr:tRNA dihydrouridine synthase DusB [Deltaproteobacteria bacterium]